MIFLLTTIQQDEPEVEKNDIVEIFKRKYRVFDISVSIGSQHIDYPGDPEFKREIILDKTSNPFELSALSMSSHCATHIDFPAHFIKDGKRAGDYKITDFIMPAHVIEVSGKEIRADHLNQVNLNPGDAVLFKTQCSQMIERRKNTIIEDNPYFDPKLCKYLANSKIKLAAIDYLTPDKFGDNMYAAHNLLLNSGILILENINLSGIEIGKYTLFCFGLKIDRAEAVPTRAVIFKEFV